MNNNNYKHTIIVNLFAGPGAGKTTCAWAIASELKKKGIETEYVSEYAKELVWDNNTTQLDGSLEHQREIFEEQDRRVQRLIGKVDVVVTDSPALLGTFYLANPNKAFTTEMLKRFNAQQNFNLFIQRGKSYHQIGRLQNLEESKAIDDRIINFLNDNNIYYGVYNHYTLGVLVNNIIKNIGTVNLKNHNKNRQSILTRLETKRTNWRDSPEADPRNYTEQGEFSKNASRSLNKQRVNGTVEQSTDDGGAAGTGRSQTNPYIR